MKWKISKTLCDYPIFFSSIMSKLLDFFSGKEQMDPQTLYFKRLKLESKMFLMLLNI